MIIRLSHPLALIRTILSKLFCILIHILISLLHKVEVDVKQVPQRKKMFGIKILQFERLNDCKLNLFRVISFDSFGF